MHVMIMSGSRDPEGQTATAVDNLADGVTAVGSTMDRAFLPDYQIERCRQCEANGWGTCRTAGKCAINDDFEALAERLRVADAAVFATPVYFSDVSESLRCFLERLRRVTRCEEAKAGLAGKPVVGICVAGGGGGGAPTCAASLERLLATTGFEVVDMIPVRRQNQALKMEVLRLTGEWLASQPAG